jgi:hypothetical protein
MVHGQRNALLLPLSADRRMIRLQALLVLASLCAALMATRPGCDGVLVRLGHAEPAAWAALRGERLLGRGALPHSIIIRVDARAGQWEALRAGLLLLPVSHAVCGRLLIKEG